MKTTLKALLAGLLAALVFPALVGLAADDAVVLPAGSLLQVRLGTTLTSKTNKTGDIFTGMIDKPVVANGKEILPEGSLVEGHVAFIKPAKRIKGRAEMRIVLDHVTTPDEVKVLLAGTLADAQGSPCAKTGSDDEGTVKGCAKSMKDAAKDAGFGAAVGAGAGATVGMGSEIECRYYGNCGGPGIITSSLYGAGAGAVTALIFNLFKHEKEVILLEGSHLTFVINRSVEAPPAPAAAPATPPANTN